MSNNKQQITELLASSLFVTEANKKLLLAKLDDLSDAQAEEIYNLLQEAEEKQDFLLQRVVEHNPNFLAELEQIEATEMRKIRENSERESQAKDETELAGLEEELSNIS